MQLKTDGIVIRQRKINDNDRYLTLLTRDSGVIRVYANNANSMKSALCTSTSLMCYSDFVINETKGRYRVLSADLKNAFFKIGSSLEKVSLAAYLFDFVETVGADSVESEPLLRLLLNVLYFLEKDDADIWLLKTVFEVRALTLCGFAPQLTGCSQCGVYNEREMYFSVLSGELTCPSCRQQDPVQNGLRKLEADLLQALRVMVFGSLSDSLKIILPTARMRKLTEITEDFGRFQVEKQFDTLQFFYSFV